jgi:hypothetical protein
MPYSSIDQTARHCPPPYRKFSQHHQNLASPEAKELKTLLPLCEDIPTQGKKKRDFGKEGIQKYSMCIV